MVQDKTLGLGGYDFSREINSDGSQYIEITNRHTGKSIQLDNGEVIADHLVSELAPEDPEDVATKAYVDNNGGSGGSVSDNPTFDTVTANEYVDTPQLNGLSQYGITTIGTNLEVDSSGSLNATTSGTTAVDGEAIAPANLSVSAWNHIDAVKDGYTPGDTSQNITNLFESYTANNEMFYLPTGTYYMSSRYQPGNTAFFGIIGKPHATIKVNNGYEGTLFDMGESGFCSKMILKNLTIDISNSNVDCGFIMAAISDYSIIENVTIKGARDRVNSDGTTNGDRYNVRLHAVNEDAHNYVRGFRMPDGGTAGGDSQVGHAIGIRSGEPPHVGTNVFDQCYVEGFIDNGYYMKGNSGQTILRGCTAKNNANSNLRPGQNDRIENCKIILNNASSRGVSPMGLRFEECDNATVDGLYIDAQDLNGNDVMWLGPDADGLTVSNVQIDLGDSVKALEVNANSTDTETAKFENIRVNDTADDNVKNSVFHVDEHRDKVTFENVTVDSDLRGAFRLSNSSSITIRDSTLMCPDEPCIRVSGGTVDRLTVETSIFDTNSNYESIRIESGGTINRLDLERNEMNDLSQPAPVINGSIGQWHLSENWGLLNHNVGNVRVSDGGTISHGVNGTPHYVSLDAEGNDVVANPASVGSSNITVNLTDKSGNAVTSNRTIYWEAEWQP